MSPHPAVWALGALVVLAASSRAARAAGAAALGPAPVLGTGRTDLARLEARWGDPQIRAAAERWGARFFPGVPVSAMLAAGITSTSRTERGGPPDFATGLYGVELRRAEAWAADAQTLTELGRAVDTSASAFGRDVDAQTYLGFRSYREHLETCARALPAELRPAEGTPWLWRLAVASYSSGEGAVSGVVRGVEPRAELVASPHRWATLGRAIVAASAAGRRAVGGVSIRGRWHAAYLVLRCERRFRAGRALALARPELAAELGWYAGEELPAETASALEPLAREA